MRQIIFFFLLFVTFSTNAVNAVAQFTDFPAGYDAVPKTKLKGAIHTVLTIEQRGERVFETVAEVYDKNGRLAETLSSNANIEIHSGELVRLGGKQTFTYDANGKLVEKKYFRPEGEQYLYTTYLYDSKNLLVEEITFDEKGKETSWRTAYTYFPTKREVEVKWAGIKVLLSYNENNQWTKRTEYDSTGKPGRFINFEYDNNGNLIKTSKGSYGHTYSYKFDKQGNWIERRNDYFQSGENGKEEIKPDWMRTYRIITYYSDDKTKP